MAIAALPGAETFLASVARLDQSRRAQAATAVSLPPILASGFQTGGRATVSIASGRDLVSKAVAAANSAQTVIEYALAKAREAGDDPVVDAVSGVSRETLGAEIKLAIRQLDRTVADSAVDGNNLVVGGGGELRIATTGLGGTVTVPVFGLDGGSLGIDRLDFGSEAGLADAVSRLASALGTVRANQQQLSTLARSFDLQDTFLDDLRAAISGRAVGAAQGYGSDGRGDTPSAAKGLVINLFA